MIAFFRIQYYVKGGGSIDYVNITTIYIGAFDNDIDVENHRNEVYN